MTKLQQDDVEATAAHRRGRGGFMGDFLRESNQGLEDEASSARQEAEALRAKLKTIEGNTPIQSLDPKRIHPSRFCNRHQAAFRDIAFMSLQASIKDSGGNVVPILVRPVNDQFEIAYGHRRHAACLKLDVPVKATVAVLTDRELLLAMQLENAEREAPSAFEMGRHLHDVMSADPPVFSSQREMAAALSIEASALTRLLRFSELPSSVVDAFQDPREIRVYWVPVLLDRVRVDPKGMQQACKALADRNDELSALAAFRQLTGSPETRDKLLLVGTKRFAKLQHRLSGATISLGKNVPSEAIDEVMDVLKNWRDRLEIEEP